MGDIVNGPWGSHPVGPDDEKIQEEVQEELIAIASVMFTQLEMMGITLDTIDDIRYMKDLGLMCESIRSFLLKIRGRVHIGQKIADEMFAITPEGLKTQTEIHVEWK